MDDNVTKILLEIKEEQGEQRGTLNQILEQTKKTNGNVLDLQKRVTTLEVGEAKEAGAGDVKKDVGNKAWSIIDKAIGAAIGAAIGVVIGKVTK
mgnify:CR=1 FL=1